MSSFRRATGPVLVAVLIAALAVGSPAAAHPGHDGGQIVVDGVEPAQDGVRVQPVAGSVGKVRLTTTGSTAATVLASSGQPILRSSPRGVEANTSSPDWYSVNEPLGIAQIPPSAKRSAPPRWRRVSTLRSWEWFDHRFHPANKAVYKWSIPLMVDGRRARIRGRVATLAGTLEVKPSQGLLPPEVTVAGIGSPLPAVQLGNDGDAPVRVLGPDGEVFARIGRQSVEVNVRSPAWVPTAQASNRSLLDSVIDPSAKPKFVLLSQEPQLIWPDPRVLEDAPVPGGSGGEAASWSIPVSVGDAKPVRLVGVTVLAPAKAETPSPAKPAPTVATARTSSPGGSDWPMIVAGFAAAVALAAVAAYTLGRRRAR